MQAENNFSAQFVCSRHKKDWH